MLSENQVKAVEETAEELQRRRENRAALQKRKAAQAAAVEKKAKAAPVKDAKEDEDLAWAKANLRFNGDEPVLDIANALRVLKRHETFAGRFRFNDTLNKVMDKGSVMLDWRVAEVVAVIQERFLPGISEAAVNKALIVHANHEIQK